MATSSLQMGIVGLIRLVSSSQQPDISPFKLDSSELYFAHSTAIHCSLQSVYHYFSVIQFIYDFYTFFERTVLGSVRV